LMEIWDRLKEVGLSTRILPDPRHDLMYERKHLLYAEMSKDQVLQSHLLPTQVIHLDDIYERLREEQERSPPAEHAPATRTPPSATLLTELLGKAIHDLQADLATSPIILGQK
jgi:hypothetical protein